jgi:hypothetical protein
MTKDSLSDTAALRALLSETSDTHLLAEMLGFVADRLMALDVDQLCGAGAHERNVDRLNHRNGYRSRAWETRAGTVDAEASRSCAKAATSRQFLEPRRLAEEGADRGHPGGLHPRHLDALGGRSGQGHGHERACRRARSRGCAARSTSGSDLPEPADRRRVALCLARRHLHQGPPLRPHRLGRGHRGRRRQQWTAGARCWA